MCSPEYVRLYWKHLSGDPLRPQLLLYVYFMIPSGSKPSPGSFAFIAQFKEKVKTQTMKVLDRCSLEWELPPLAVYSLLALNITSSLSPFLRENDQHHQSGRFFVPRNSDSLACWKWCKKRINNFELFMWFLPLTQLLLRVLKKQQPLQEHQVFKWFISSQTLIFNPGVGINSIEPSGSILQAWTGFSEIL